MICNESYLNKIGKSKDSINENNLNLLRDFGLLTSSDDNLYIVKDYNLLFQFGIYLSSYELYDKAFGIFNICLSFNKFKYDAAFQLFLIGIIKTNMNNVYKYLDILLEDKDNKYCEEIKYFLFLLNLSFDLPCKYMDIIREISYEEVFTSNDCYREINVNNKIRNTVLKNEISIAKKISEKLLSGNSLLEEKVQDYLLKSALIYRKKLNQKIYNAIRNKDYIEARSLIENYSIKLVKLDKVKINIIILINVILSIKNNTFDFSSKKDNIYYEDVFDAINNGNYFEALKICKLNMDDTGEEYYKSPIYLLLNEICTLINSHNSGMYIESDSLDSGIGILNFDLLFCQNNFILLNSDYSFIMTSLKDSSNIKYYYIDIDGNDYLLLFRKTDDVFDTLFDKTINEYQNNLLNEAKEDTLKLISLSKTSCPFLYGLLGFIYLKENDIPSAIKFIGFASTFSSKEKYEFDYGTFSFDLNFNFYKSNPMLFFKLPSYSSEVNDDAVELNTINEYVVENGLSVTEACSHFEISKIDKIKILLYYAKDFYIRGLFDEGDLCIREVSKNSNLSESCQRFLDDINKNKYYYYKRQKARIKSLKVDIKI